MFEQAGGFDVSLPQAADYLMWVKLMLASDVAFIAEPLNYWRWHKHSITWKFMNHPADAQDVEEIYQVVLFLARQLNVPKRQHEAACRRFGRRRGRPARPD